MSFVAAICPQCSGALQVPEERDIVKCMYCGVDVVVRQAIQLVSGSSKNFLVLAEAAAAAENYAEAFTYFTKALEIDPNNASAWFGKGTAAGWMSKVNQLRLSEMTVAFDRAIGLSPESERPVVKIACANTLTSIAAGHYKLARNHLLEFVELSDSWVEYVDRCQQAISAHQAAYVYDRTNQQALRNLIEVCVDIIHGVKFKDSKNKNQTKVLHLTRDNEKRIRALLFNYGTKVAILDPSYDRPDPQRVSANCFVVTATMGDEGHPSVLLLKSFRDTTLSTTTAGRAFISWYYIYGPLVAWHIERSVGLRIVCYVLLVVPAVTCVRIYDGVRYAFSRIASRFNS